MNDDRLSEATRALRDAFDGEPDKPDETLARVLETLAAKNAQLSNDDAKTGASVTRLSERPKARSLTVRRLSVRSAVALAAALAMTTAWAAKQGKLGHVWQMVSPFATPTSYQEAPSSSATQQPKTPPVASNEPGAIPGGESTTTERAEAHDEAALPSANDGVNAPPTKESPKAVVEAPKGTAPTKNAAPKIDPTTTTTSREASAKDAGDPTDAVFANANRLHFDGDYTRALTAWDEYLAVAPNGRFAPEARFNRAIALWKLGRHDEAKKALEPFANGAYGDYRRDEATRLIQTK